MGAFDVDSLVGDNSWGFSIITKKYLEKAIYNVTAT